MNPRLLTALLLSAPACLAQAQSTEPQAPEPQPEPETITISASRMERPLREVGVSVSVLDAERIQALGRLSLADVLRTLPGLAVSNSGGPGKQSTLRIRGEEGFRTRVLVDGIDISDSSSTQIQAQLEHYLAAGVERIEVLRGPQGMMYGADAGGVVNITTRRAAAGLNGGLGAEYGSFDTRRLDAYLNGGSESMDFSLNLNDVDSAGFNARTDDVLLADDDGYANTSLAAAFGATISENWRLELGLHDIDSTSEFDNCFGLSGSSNQCSSDFDQQTGRFGIAYQGSAVTHSLGWQSNATERRNITDAIPGGVFGGELDQLLYTGTYQWENGNALLFGFDHQSAGMDDGSFSYERDQDAVFSEWQSGLGENFFYTVGLRHDDNDDFGSHNSLRISAAYLLALGEATDLKFKASLGNGFRAPSLYEEAYNRSTFAYPPASSGTLKEELSQGGDIGLELFNDSGLHVEAVYFYQRIEDAIEFDLAGFSGYVQSQGRSRAQGLELLLAQALSPVLDLQVNYTYTDSRDTSDRQRIRRPRHTANLSLAYTSPDQSLRLQAGLRHSAGTVDEYFDDLSFSTVRAALDDYTVANFSASYRLSEQLEIFAVAENLFDEDYTEIINYRMAGFNAHGGVRLQF